MPRRQPALLQLRKVDTENCCKTRAANVPAGTHAAVEGACPERLPLHHNNAVGQHGGTQVTNSGRIIRFSRALRRLCPD